MNYYQLVTASQNINLLRASDTFYSFEFVTLPMHCYSFLTSMFISVRFNLDGAAREIPPVRQQMFDYFSVIIGDTVLTH
jgi:hypothetical protein